MSFTHSLPPGRTRQQRDRKPRQQQQWDSEEQDVDVSGYDTQPSAGHSHYSAYPRREPQRYSSHKRTVQHGLESPQQQQQHSLEQYVFIPLSHNYCIISHSHGSYYVKAPNAAKRDAVTESKELMVI